MTRTRGRLHGSVDNRQHLRHCQQQRPSVPAAIDSDRPARSTCARRASAPSPVPVPPPAPASRPAGPSGRTLRRSPRRRAADRPLPAGRPPPARCGRGGTAPARRRCRPAPVRPARCPPRWRRPATPRARSASAAASRSPSPLSPSVTIRTARRPVSPSCSNALTAVEKRGRHVGGRIAQVVRAGRVEEEPQRGAIGGERELEERAAAEHHQPDPVARVGRHHVPRELLRRGEAGAGARYRAGRDVRSRPSSARGRAAPARRGRCAPARSAARRPAAAPARPLRGRAPLTRSAQTLAECRCETSDEPRLSTSGSPNRASASRRARSRPHDDPANRRDGGRSRPPEPTDRRSSRRPHGKVLSRPPRSTSAAASRNSAGASSQGNSSR